MSAAKVVLSCFDSVRFHINFLTEIINIFVAVILLSSTIQMYKFGQKIKNHSTPSLMNWAWLVRVVRSTTCFKSSCRRTTVWPSGTTTSRKWCSKLVLRITRSYSSSVTHRYCCVTILGNLCTPQVQTQELRCPSPTVGSIFKKICMVDYIGDPTRHASTEVNRLKGRNKKYFSLFFTQKCEKLHYTLW